MPTGLERLNIVRILVRINDNTEYKTNFLPKQKQKIKNKKTLLNTPIIRRDTQINYQKKKFIINCFTLLKNANKGK